MKRFCVGVLLVMLSAAALAQPGQSEFVPVTEVPASEQLPAAPLVIGAYAFVWAALTAYVVVMWRKLGKVEQEISALSAQIAKKAR
jgi:CcmD family protein